ncbi:MAG: NrdH-redoxin [Anaerolineae bacterium]|nr:NrdH-redoxin [Anaerolineae bacterium]
MIEDNSASEITFYGTRWCGQSIRSFHLLKKKGVDFTYIDIDKDGTAAKKVMSLNNGYRSVPTILFPDGTHLVEPSMRELLAKVKELQA